MKFEVKNFSEIDEKSIKLYEKMHKIDKNRNLGDILRVENDAFMHYDMVCGSPPHKELSGGGHKYNPQWHCPKCMRSYNPFTIPIDERGGCPKCKFPSLDKDEGALIAEFSRAVHNIMPKWAFLETSKGILSGDVSGTFDMFIDEVSQNGYNAMFQVLNSKGFGVPQNRERLYIVFVRQDLDNGKFSFPIEKDNGTRIRDILDKNYDQILNIDTDFGNKFLLENEHIYDRPPKKEDTYQPILIGNMCDTKRKRKPHSGEIYFPYGISPMLPADLCSRSVKLLWGYHIRSLSFFECCRLMGIRDSESAPLLGCGISESQILHRVGIGIVVDVVYEIFKNLHDAMPFLFEDMQILSLFSGIGSTELALSRLYKEYINK